MKDAANKSRAFFYCALVFTAICAVLRTLSIFTSFDADVEYFRSDAILPYLHNALATVSTVFFISFFYFVKKNTLPTEAPENSTVISFSSVLCGFIYAMGSVMFYLANMNTAGVAKHVIILNYLVEVFGLISAFYFIYDGITPRKRGLTAKIVSSAAVILNLLLYVVLEHLDYKTAINTPNKTMIMLCFIATALFIIQDARFKVGTARPRLYVVSGCITALLCGCTSVSGIICHYSGILHNSRFLIFYLMQLALAVYVFAKLYSYSKYAGYEAALPEQTPEESPESDVCQEAK